MPRTSATVISLRSRRLPTLDLPLALAMLSKGVRAHEKAQRARLALLARASFWPVTLLSHANPRGG